MPWLGTGHGRQRDGLVECDQAAVVANGQREQVDVAARDRISLGEAISRLVRQGATAQPQATAAPTPLRGRFALLPQRDEVITPDHIRQLMEREGL